VAGSTAIVGLCVMTVARRSGFRAGHVPMIGEWVALPVLSSAGADQDVAIARELGIPVWHRVEDVPGYVEDAA